jgi:hypothetical protein
MKLPADKMMRHFKSKNENPEGFKHVFLSNEITMITLICLMK